MYRDLIGAEMSEQHTHAGGHSEDSSTGVHGMLLFGEEVLYLSHLPMFASPHNFQVLLEVGLDDAAREAFLSDRHVAGDGIHTFVPQPFPIAELAPRADGPARTSIEGTIFRGHFERGGEPIAEGVVTEVHRVVHFSELDVGAKRTEDRELTYLCFGRAGRLHLAHEVTARPVPLADFVQRRAARNYTLALDVVCPVAPASVAAMVALATAG